MIQGERMKRILLYVAITLFVTTNIFAGKNAKDFFVIPTGDSLAIYLTFSPRSNSVYDVYRKTDSGFVKITKKSVRAEMYSDKAKVRLENEWKFLTNRLKTDDETSILRAIKRNDFNAWLLNLISPKVAEVSGRLVYDSNVDLGSDYTYKIIFHSISGVKKDSLVKSVSTKLNIPEKPKNLSVENIKNVAHLAWSYPEWKGDYSNLGFRYNVYRSTDNLKFEKVNKIIIIRDDKNNPFFKDAWLKRSRTYYYKVTIVDPQGNESKPSDVVKILMKDNVAPKIITNLNSNSTAKGIGLSWNMASELDAMGYNIYRSLSLNGKTDKINKTLLPIGKPYFTDSLVTIDKQYFYRVSAVDSTNNESELSNWHARIWEDFTPPEPVTKLVGVPQKGKVKLTWNQSKTKGIKGYMVFRGLDSNTVLRQTENLNLETTFIDSGFQKDGYNYGETLHYFVYAVDSSRNRSEKAYVKVKVPDVTPPKLPTIFSVNNHIGIYANVVINKSLSKDVAKYYLYKNDKNGNSKLFKTFIKAPISYRDSSVVKGNTYYYAISVEDSVGNKSEISDVIKLEVKDSNPPPTPRNFVAKLKDEKVVLNWKEVIDFDLVGYNIYSSNRPSGTYKKLNSEPISGLTYTDSKGTKNTFYRVRSVDSSGNESKYEKSIAVK